MSYEVSLVVDGVDLELETTVQKIAASLDYLAWSVVDARVNATLFVEGLDPVCEAIEAARHIEHVLPDAKVVRVEDDLVSIAEVAQRLGVNRETVRTWVTGARGPGGFPVSYASFGGGERGAMKVWLWRDVAAWLNAHYQLASDELLSAGQVAQINANLHRVVEALSPASWQPVTPPPHYIPVIARVGQGEPLAARWGLYGEGWRRPNRTDALLAAPRGRHLSDSAR